MNRLTGWIADAYAAMTAVVLAVVVFCYAGTAFDSRKEYPLGQGAMLLLGVALLLLLALGTRRWEKARPLRGKGILYWGTLFVVQATLSYFAYFMTDWDVKSILESAYAIAGGDAYIEYYYYYLYPNNTVLTLVFAGIMRAFRILSPGAGLERCTYILIVFQCAINTAVGMLTARLARRLTGSEQMGRLTALVYAAFVGLSPWVMIPYSDSVGLIFPITLFSLYLHARENRCARWVWPAMGALAALGYLIKPQTLIAAIAVAMIEGARLILSRRPGALMARLGSLTLAFWLGVGPCFAFVLDVSPIKRNDEANMGVLHYLMMGLNEETNGSFYLEDMLASSGVKESGARRKMQLETIRERIASRDLRDWAEHLTKKTLTNFADGSFAWGIEGVFFAQPIEDKDAVLSPFLKDLINSDDGRNYPCLAAYFEILWLGLLACSLCAGGTLRRLPKTQRETLGAMLLTLIGLSLFETIFEARARYFYTCAPLYVIVGLAGAWAAASAFRERGKVSCARSTG